MKLIDGDKLLRTVKKCKAPLHKDTSVEFVAGVYYCLHEIMPMLIEMGMEEDGHKLTDTEGSGAHGRWKWDEYYEIYECSECGYVVNWIDYKHCPHCKAMMEVDHETD